MTNISKQIEAMKLALEALETGGWNKTTAAITALREALALVNSVDQEQTAQQQELVGEVYRYGEDSHGRQWHGIRWYDANVDVPTGTKLYTSPQPAQPSPSRSDVKPWAGLTDVEWMNIVNKDHAWFGQRPEDVAHEVAKLVEAKLREKNAQPSKPLTDEQIDLFINGRGVAGDDDYVEPTGDGFGLTDADLVRLVRRVEAAHGIKE